MATKEQERKALEQIKKIVEGLGEVSYIGIAFEGCFADAEENIRNDFGCSMKQRWETAEEVCAMRVEQAHKLEERVKQLEKTVQEDNAVIERNAKYIDQLEARTNELLDRLHKTEDVGSENVKTLISLQSENDMMKQEIIHLKAKLYDFMTATK